MTIIDKKYAVLCFHQVFWLRNNFEEKVGHILRHDDLYQRYLLHAGKCGMKHEDILHQNTVRCIVRTTFLGLSNRCFGRKYVC